VRVGQEVQAVEDSAGTSLTAQTDSHD